MKQVTKDQLAQIWEEYLLSLQPTIQRQRQGLTVETKTISTTLRSAPPAPARKVVRLR